MFCSHFDPFFPIYVIGAKVLKLVKTHFLAENSCGSVFPICSSTDAFSSLRHMFKLIRI